MLGPHYISQKPDKARAQYPPKPAGFVENLIGSIIKNIIYSFQKPDGLGDKYVKPEPDPVPNLKARARPVPGPSPKILSPFQL